MIDIEVYRRIVFPQVEQWLKDRPNEGLDTTLSRLSLYTTCPIIVIAKFVGEIKGMTPELEGKIKRLEEFYR